MTRRFWTPAELAAMRELYSTTNSVALAERLGRPLSTVYAMAQKLGLKKCPHYMAVTHGAHVAQTGIATRFKPGQAAWNKGTNYTAGGRSPETRFRAGNTPHNWVPVGSYRVNTDGYLDRKISDLRRGAQDWEAVHRLVWKEAHGPIPADHAVVFRPGRRTTVLEDITLDALELVTRRELMARNTVQRYPPELKKTIQLMGVLRRKINTRKRNEKQDGGSAQSPVRGAGGARGRREPDGTGTG